MPHLEYVVRAWKAWNSCTPNKAFVRVVNPTVLSYLRPRRSPSVQRRIRDQYIVDKLWY